jgi:flavin reductase (DIM6/NTAB) family NADH-FMN oxidoreductase RutF
VTDFKAAMRRVPTGVTIVTTLLDDKAKGFTANAFSSVSATPPMILICVNREARSHPVISQAGIFCVNVLRLEEQAIAERFAGGKHENPFVEISWSRDATGAPVLANALAYFDCDVAEEHTVGSHTIFVGSVRACGARSGKPLGYFDGVYRDFGVEIS